MDTLSPKARALIERSRVALHAKAGDRERIESALRDRLGADALPVAESVAPLASTATWKVVIGATLGAVLMGGAVFWALDTRTSAPPPRATLAPPSVAPREVATPTTATPTRPALDAASPERSVAASQHSATRTRVPPQDELAREVALLTRATRELRAGNARKALTTLEAHRQKFPNGLLSEERRSAMAQALCMAGRVEEGRAEQAKLDPHSPAGARAKQACDAAAAPPDSR